MNKTLKISRLAGSIAVNVPVTLFSFFCVFPFVWVFYSSFKTAEEFSLSIINLPRKLNWTNFIDAIAIGRMGDYAFNSFFNSIIVLVLVVFASFITAYFLSRFSFRGRNLIYGMFLTAILIPMPSLMVPVFIEYRNVGMLNNRFTLLPVYFAFGIPTSIFLVESFIGSIPVELEEAAIIDGSSLVRTMFTIIMPLCRPVLATVVILSFMGTWNEFPFALVLIKDNILKTIPIGLRNFQGAHNAQYTEFLAGVAISLLPVIIVYSVFYKKIIIGMTEGTIKG
ncbi:MAG: carbohydrate ABC transporter permease [Treponema sp.]|jgi:raffinose/stachyose/melibiose transport system permease protein|nr:carbohydrate ABC transporter permease [Treponema sp.]